MRYVAYQNEAKTGDRGASHGMPVCRFGLIGFQTGNVAAQGWQRPARPSGRNHEKGNDEEVCVLWGGETESGGFTLAVFGSAAGHSRKLSRRRLMRVLALHTRRRTVSIRMYTGTRV